MAKVVFSALVADVRKKVGGNVFTKARAGSIVRRKVSPVQPRTSEQSAVRASFSAFSKRWASATLSDTQRAGWNALAAQYPQKDKFGASHTLTGLQMYQKVNRNLATIGNPVLDNPPATLSAGFPGALTIVATSPATLTVAPATAPIAAEYALVYAAAQQSPGRTFVGSKYRFLQAFTIASVPPWDISASYTAKFGALISAKKVAVKVAKLTVATGAKGVPSTALQVVT